MAIPSPLFMLFPKRYIKPLSDINLERWSEEHFEWEPDPLGGVWDTVSSVHNTLHTGKGDCDDYALVALSALYGYTDDLKLVVLLSNGLRPPFGHMLVYDGDHVYESGNVHYTTTPEEFAETYGYRILFSRAVK